MSDLFVRNFTKYNSNRKKFINSNATVVNNHCTLMILWFTAYLELLKFRYHWSTIVYYYFYHTNMCFCLRKLETLFLDYNDFKDDDSEHISQIIQVSLSTQSSRCSHLIGS